MFLRDTQFFRICGKRLRSEVARATTQAEKTQRILKGRKEKSKISCLPVGLGT